MRYKRRSNEDIIGYIGLAVLVTIVGTISYGFIYETQWLASFAEAAMK